MTDREYSDILGAIEQALREPYELTVSTARELLEDLGRRDFKAANGLIIDTFQRALKLIALGYRHDVRDLRTIASVALTITSVEYPNKGVCA